MTLLFSYIDDHYVMHVADERISRWDRATKQWEVVDDDTAKQILVRGSILISFTGPIAIDGATPTAEWLAKRFADPDPDRAIEDILDDAVERLTLVFDRIRFRDQCLTFIIGGWAKNASGNLEPVYGEITNQNPNTFGRLPRFVAYFGYLPPGAHWHWRGQPLRKTTAKTLRRQIDHALNAGISPPVLQRLLLDAMRATARRSKLVGPSALIGALPRASMDYANAHPDDFWVVGNQQASSIPGQAMFVRVPAGDDRVVSYKPIIV